MRRWKRAASEKCVESGKQWNIQKCFVDMLATEIELEKKEGHVKYLQSTFENGAFFYDFFLYFHFAHFNLDDIFFFSVPEFDSHAHCAPKWHYQVDGATPVPHFNIFSLANSSTPKLHSLSHDSFVRGRRFSRFVKRFYFQQATQINEEIWANNVMRTYILSGLFAFHLPCLLQYWMAHIPYMLQMFFLTYFFLLCNLSEVCWRLRVFYVA